jgi:predicted DNA-binding transcriptional regulator AlpA
MAARATKPQTKHRSHHRRRTLAERIFTPPTIEEQAERLFDVEGLSKYLNRPIHWIYMATSKGSTCPLPFIKLGRFLKFRRSSIDAWLASQERQQEVAKK